MRDWGRIATIGVVVLFCVALILFDSAIKPIQLSIIGGIKPAIELHRSASLSISTFFSKITAPFRSDTTEQRREIARLQDALQAERAKNSRLLRELSQVSPFHEYSALKPVPCEILYSDPAGAANVIVLNAGSNSGIQTGMALCSGFAVVGTIYHVSKSVSIAVLLKHPLCRIPVRISPGGERGIAVGNGKAVEIRFVPIEASVSIGAAVSSSDETGLVPLDLLVGVIRSAKREESRLSWKIEIELNSASNVLEDLYVPVGLSGAGSIHIPKELK